METEQSKTKKSKRIKKKENGKETKKEKEEQKKRRQTKSAKKKLEEKQKSKMKEQTKITEKKNHEQNQEGTRSKKPLSITPHHSKQAQKYLAYSHTIICVTTTTLGFLEESGEMPGHPVQYIVGQPEVYGSVYQKMNISC